MTIWNFSQFRNLYYCVWFFSTLCCKVCEVVQTLVERKLVQSCKKIPPYIHVQTSLPLKSYKPTYTQNPPLKLWLGKNVAYCFISFKFYCYGTQFHLFTFAMFWLFCQLNKAWFIVVGNNLPWNALEVVKVD
jgi:hypothetical protein